MTNDEDIRAALSYIDPHDRDTWVNTAYSLKNELGESGFDLWDQWSQQSDNYNNRAARSVWKSIKAPKRSIGSLFHEARANGYRPEKPYTPPSAEEQAKRRAERETARLAEEAALAKKQTEVKQLSGRIWQRAEPATAGHPYLTAKGITDPAIMGQLRLNEYQGQTNLLVPVYYEQEMVNLQSILPDGTKRFFEGGRVKGGYSVVGKAEDYQNGLVLAEGFATAASIHQATGKPVIVAFHAGNLVPIAERLAKVLPEQVPITIAVDNDASQTGMKKALQAAAVLGERAHVVEPVFTMTQIQRYQTENGLDSQGRPKLPSDFNDLHHLAGLDAVRRTLEPVLRQAEPPVAEREKPVETKQPSTEQTITEPPAEQDWDAIAAEEARQRGIRLPPSPTTAPSTQAAIKAASLYEESNMNRTDQASEVNTIEYDGRRQQQSPTVEPPVEQPEAVKAAPEAEPPAGQPAAKARKAEAEPEIKAQAAPSLSEKKPVLDLNYRIPPDSIKSRYVVADGQYLAADNLSTVLFTDSGKKLSTPLANVQVVNDMLEVAKEKGWGSLKLNGSKEFKAMMYVAAESQGIRTSGYTPTEADKAAVARLLQERSLNSVENRSAREQSIPEPAAAQTAQTDAVKQNEGRIVAYGSAPYRNDPKAQPSYYLMLEQQGKTHTVWGIGLADALEQSGAQPGDTIRLHHLGRQPVTVEAPVYDKQGAVVDHKTLNTHRNQFQIEITGREQQQEKKVRTQPDVAALSAADKLEAQSALPSDSTVNVSDRADTQPGVPVHAIGSEEVPARVHRQANDLRSEALNTEMVAAKTAYMAKAAKLSKPNKARLQFYERSTMDALRGLTGDVRTKALRNYYEHTEKMMSGSKLKLPEPAQIPAPGQPVAEQQMQQQTRQQQAERSHQRQEMATEIER